ncbi:UDP-N-acetylmuramate--L-alanine ligase, partial [Rhizobium ruizarguesonis]
DPIEGIDSVSLVSRIKSGGHRDARFINSAELLPQMVAEVAKPGDFVVLLGAGSITSWAAALPKQLEGLSGKSV